MDLAYERTGAGEPLVLIHGLGHRRQGWDPVIALLAAEREVIVFDLPGHGASPALPSGQVDYAEMVGEVEKFLRGLGLEQPHVAGNSLGGLIAIDLGAGGYARTVTAISPAGYWNRAERAWVAAVFRVASLVGARLPSRLVVRIAGLAPARVALFGLFFGRPGRHDPAVLAEDLRRLGTQRPTILSALAHIKQFEGPSVPPASVPTTIAWGRRDLLLFPHQARRAKKSVRHARRVGLPGCGHVAMGDDAELVARVLLEGSRVP